jgi:uncharacterized small protein (DUF1192 family)
MDWEEDVKKPSGDIAIGAPLDAVSIEELRHRIEALKVEIARCETEIERKSQRMSEADAIFRK